MSELPLQVDIESDQDGEYRVEWYCTPPARGQWYSVTREEWVGDYTIRRIYEWTTGDE